ncbi:MAG: MBL fold metallo-hydrolase RNA specificity domain-containing protein [Nocardioides sp.]
MSTHQSDPTLRFLGAAGTVTGSKFLLETPGARVLVDCGLFQGAREWRRRNWDDLPFDAGSLDAVVITHAHLDHSGAVPLLARHGFSGPIVCTPATAKLAAIVLRDAAHLQEEEAEYANRAGFSKHAPALPLFDSADAEKAISLLRPLDHDDVGTLPGGMKLHLRRAGHILGSAFVEIEVEGVRTLFSGDMGRPEHPLLMPPAAPNDADVVVVESTYGDREHEQDGDDALADVISRTSHRGGVCLLPAFAVDRTPVLLMALTRLKRDDKIPDLPIYVDSPMALHALEVYRASIGRHDPDVRPEIGTAGHLFEPPGLHLMPTREDSEKLNRPGRPCIIISASGMATGGRVLHHLGDQLPNSRNSVILTGFQVPGTRGRALADGARSLKIHGRYVPVRAEVASLRGYSAHADAAQLVAWLSDIRTPRTAYVVHGEPSAAEALAARLATDLGWTAVVPHYLEKVRLD